MTNRIFLSGAVILLLAIGAAAQSGGQFAISQSAIAAGGAQSAGGQFAVADTKGQTVAGQRATSAVYSLHAGFWNPDQYVPTAAEVAVGGRITTPDGSGIRNVRVTLTGANGEIRMALSGPFGYFRFTEVPSGVTYVITASAKRYQFSEPTQIRTIVEDVEDIVFVALAGLLNNK